MLPRYISNSRLQLFIIYTLHTRYQFRNLVVHSQSHVWLFATAWTAACRVPLSFTISWSFLRFMCNDSVTLFNHLTLWSPPLPSIFSSTGVFSNESALCIRWPKYWSFVSISLFNECSGLISFRIDWFDFPCCSRDSLLQHYK